MAAEPDRALETEKSRRRDNAREHRMPPALAVIVAGGIYAFLPNRLLFAPRLVVPAVEVVLLVTVLVTQTRRRGVLARVSRVCTAAVAGVVIVTNLVALGMLVAALPDSSASGQSLLVGAMQVWVTNVIGFALLYWELDRGGPVARRELRRDRLAPADWRFSQDEDADAVTEVAASASLNSGWIPLFVDYLYMSLTNSSAFSPTDTMPLTTRAKALMGLQATSALLVSLLIIARAVGTLTG